MTASAAKLLRDGCEKIAKAPKGRRNHALQRTAYELGLSGLSEDYCLDAVISACKGSGYIPEENEGYVRKTFKEHLSHGFNQRNVTALPVNGAREAKQPTRLPWREMRGSTPIASFHNAKVGIAPLVKIRHDVFHDVMTIETTDEVQHTAAPLIGEVSDAVLLRLRNLFSDTYDFDAGENHIWAAVQALAVTINPVLDMIDMAEAQWDGKSRLDRLAADYLSAEDTELNAAAASKHLIAGVRRVRSPGCKYDVMLVLEGPEGWNKSSAIRTLAGSENFSDENILGAQGKEAMEQLGGIWFHECAELAGIRRADVETVKAFLSRSVDRHRKAYGRIVTNQPRHSIEWGTTNDSQYLISQTGNRRFAPLRLVRAIDIAKLERDRLQLIGEAAHRESQREPLTIPESMWDRARAEQEKRRMPDPWEDKIANIPDMYLHPTADGREVVSFSDVVSNVLGIPAAQQSPAMGKRIAQAMEMNGWQRPAGPIRINSRNTRGYWRYRPE